MKRPPMSLKDRLELAAQACRAAGLLSCEETCREAASSVPSSGAVATDEAVKLGKAIADAAQRAGIYNGEGALDGPTLLLLLNDMADVLEDRKRLTRELDVAMHGEEGAAKQASLCDLIPLARRLREQASSALPAAPVASNQREELELIRSVLYGFPAGIARNDALRAVHALLDSCAESASGEKVMRDALLNIGSYEGRGPSNADWQAIVRTLGKIARDAISAADRGVQDQ